MVNIISNLVKNVLYTFLIIIQFKNQIYFKIENILILAE